MRFSFFNNRFNAIYSIAISVIFMLASTGISHAGSLSVSVVDKDGKPTLDAVVMVTPSAAGAASAAKTQLPLQATISQASMQFVPAVSIVRPGAKVTFVNNDSWDHHVRGTASGAAQFSSSNEGGFEMRLAGKTAGSAGKSAIASFDKAGVVLLGCHIHGSMVGHVVVSETPWTAKTNASGVATFTDLPDGMAQVKVWHAAQFVDLTPVQSNIGANPAQVKMQLSVTPRRRASAPSVAPTY